MFIKRFRSMWHTVLILVLVVSLITFFVIQHNYNDYTEERILTLSASLDEMYTTVSSHAEVINDHAELINERVVTMNTEYTSTMEDNQKLINEMNDQLSEYQQLINANADYFEELQGNLKSLSVTLTE